MNAYMEGRTTPPVQDNNNEPAFDSLDGFLSATRQIESALRSERARNKRLSEEVANLHQTYDRLLKELDGRNNELKSNESKMKAAIDEYRSHTSKVEARLRSASQAYHKVKSELDQYRAAWSDVLQREREAKMILKESEETGKKLAVAEQHCRKAEETLSNERTRREQIERHAKSYQMELQSSLVRLHSAEAKFNELSKEFQLISQSKRSIDEEIRKIEHSMRERFQWELAKEREKFQSEAQKLIATEREQIRMMGRESPIFRDELMKCLAAEKEALWKRIREEYPADAERVLTEERERFARLRETLEGQIHTLRESLNRKTQEMSVLRDSAETRERELEARMAETRTEAGTLENRLNIFKDQIENMREASEDLRRELERAEIERSRSENIDLELKSAHNEISKLRKELEEKDERIRKLRERAEDAAGGPTTSMAVEKSLAMKEQRLAMKARMSAERMVDEIIAAERKRASEMVAAIGAAPKRRLFSLSRASGSRKTREELELLARSFESAFNTETERSSSLESALLAERARFDEIIASLEAEVDELAISHPLKDSLAACEMDISMTEQDLRQYSRGSDEHSRLARKIVSLRERKEKLRILIYEAEKRGQEIRACIEKSSESGLLAAEPAEQTAHADYLDENKNLMSTLTPLAPMGPDGNS